MLRLVVFIFLGIFSTLMLLGNKNGRASQSQRGNTGAPGDEMQGGQVVTCMNCHNQGPILASVAVSVLDSSNNPVTQYVPGQMYTARVTITASGPDLMGYGFQMIGLRDSNNSDLDGFSDMNPNNYKLATIPGGRTYAEHDNISTTNLFNVTWTAPTTGTGSVTLYAAGNGVNANGGTGGDGAGFGSIQLTELSSATTDPAGRLPKLTVSPNPVQSESTLNLENIEAGHYELSAFDLSGKKVWVSRQDLAEGSATVVLPSSSWLPGVYFLRLLGGNKATSVKVLKL
ncbi:MAG: choice-of-anchor V domain-containing protein [Saprospiraceae bacterium]|nr:choice-of-anchor V domain-containing protein [Saprospiraceae bacterium]